MRSRAQEYARSKRALWLADLALTLLLLGGLIGNRLAQRLGGFVAAHIAGGPLQVAAYVGIIGSVFTAIGFPLEWLRSFALEHRFGLSNQRLGQWLWEYAKRVAVGGILGLLVVEGLAWLLMIAPQSWWQWAALLWLGWSVVLTRFFPTLLIPLFYRQRPLEENPVRQRLESLCERCGTKVGGIFEVNLSRTTRKANACLCGLGSTRRVLVSDTLLSGYPPEEIEVVLAHEVGHHRLHHLGILTASSALAMGVSLFWVDRISRRWLLFRGLSPLNDLSSLPVIGLGLFLAGLFLMPLTNGISRWCEAQADRFALRMTGNPQAFIAAMRRLAEQNLAELEPPRWVEWLLYDHPPIAKRIAMAQRGAG